MRGGVKVQLHPFLTAALDRRESSDLSLSRFSPGKIASDMRLGQSPCQWGRYGGGRSSLSSHTRPLCTEDSEKRCALSDQSQEKTNESVSAVPVKCINAPARQTLSDTELK